MTTVFNKLSRFFISFSSFKSWSNIDHFFLAIFHEWNIWIFEFIMIAVQLFIVNRLQKIVFIFILLLITTGLYRKRWMPQNLRTILITTKSRHCSIIKKLRRIRRTRKNLPIWYIRLMFKFWDSIVIFRRLWIGLAICWDKLSNIFQLWIWTSSFRSKMEASIHTCCAC